MNAGMKLAYHHKDLRNALVEEALALLAEGGAASVTLRELARRLGVTHTAPYAHFQDKKALLLDVADAGFHKLANALDAARTSGADAVTALGEMSFSYIKFARENPHLYRLMFADPEIADDPECEMSPEGDRALQILVDAIVDVGPPAGTDVRDLAIGLWSLAHGVSMLEIDRRIAGKTMKSAEDVISLMNVLILGALR
jgi:AcrR family transcriptional regulator